MTDKGHPALLSSTGLTKHYGPVKALTDVAIEVRHGEIVGLIGENGAGKSTLLDILSGVTRQDEGAMSLRANTYQPRSYREATEQGVFRVFQNLSLVPSARVYENLYLAHEYLFSKVGVIRTKAMREAATEVLHRFGHGWIDANARVSQYDFATRQVIEIVKCFALASQLEVEHPLLLLDEPTAGLAGEDIQFFKELVLRVRKDSGVLFVSHRLGEIGELSDRAYVLRDGQCVGERTRAEQMEQDDCGR